MASESTHPRRDRWAALVLGVYGAAALLSGVAARGLGTFEPDSPLGTGGLKSAVILIALLSVGGLAWVVRRGRLLDFGGLPLAAGLAVILAGWGLSLPAVLPSAVEAAGGAVLIGGFIAWLSAGAVNRPPRRPKGKVQLVRAEGRTVAVARDALGPGDRVRVPAAEPLPADGRVVEAGATFDASDFGIVAAMNPRPSEPVFEGWIPDAEVDVAIERAPRDGLQAQWAQATSRVEAELRRPRRLEIGAAVVIGGVALVAFALRVAYGPSVALPLFLVELAALTLATAVGLPALVGGRHRAAALGALTKSGWILTRPDDLHAVVSASRWQIDPRLLAGPGPVEVVSFDDTPKAHLLALARALLAERDHPDRAALERAAQSAGATSLRGAGFSSRGEVMMGTIGGTRWHLGPRAELERQTGPVPRTLQGTIGFLTDRGHRVLLLASPDRGVTGAFGIQIEADAAVTEVGRALEAEIAPGLSTDVRTQLGHKSGLGLADGLGGKGTCVLLHPDSPPPTAGVGVRVLPLMVGLELREAGPRVLAPSLPSLPRALAEARSLVHRGQSRGWWALLPPMAAGGLAFAGVLWPAVGALLGALAVGWTSRGHDGRDAKSPGVVLEADEEAVEVTLSGVEAAVASPKTSPETEVTLIETAAHGGELTSADRRTDRR